MLSVLEKLVSLEAGKLAPFYDLDMKYIDADRLRAEISRRIKSHKELSEKPEMSDVINFSSNYMTRKEEIQFNDGVWFAIQTLVIDYDEPTIARHILNELNMDKKEMRRC